MGWALVSTDWIEDVNRRLGELEECAGTGTADKVAVPSAATSMACEIRVVGEPCGAADVAEAQEAVDNWGNDALYADVCSLLEIDDEEYCPHCGHAVATIPLTVDRVMEAVEQKGFAFGVRHWLLHDETRPAAGYRAYQVGSPDEYYGKTALEALCKAVRAELGKEA